MCRIALVLAWQESVGHRVAQPCMPRLLVELREQDAVVDAGRCTS
jgi:hypothetical protein